LYEELFSYLCKRKQNLCGKLVSAVSRTHWPCRVIVNVGTWTSLA